MCATKLVRHKVGKTSTGGPTAIARSRQSGRRALKNRAMKLKLSSVKAVSSFAINLGDREEEKLGKGSGVHRSMIVRDIAPLKAEFRKEDMSDLPKFVYRPTQDAHQIGEERLRVRIHATPMRDGQSPRALTKRGSRRQLTSRNKMTN